MLCGLSVGLILLPVALGLLRGHGERHDRLMEKIELGSGEQLGARQWSTREVLRDWGFYLLLPAVLAPPFIGTGLMFHQDVLRGSMGWSRELFASGFVVFSVVQVMTAPVAGALVDRFTAHRLLCSYLIPYGLALMGIALFQSELMVFILMTGMGLTAGIAYSVVGATWAERYGVRHLGAIRSLVTVVMVVSTALAPPLLGVLIDGGIGMISILIGMATYTGIASVLVLGLRVPLPRAT